MPIIEIHLMTGRTVEQKRDVAGAMALAVQRSLGVKLESIRILITEHGAEEFSVAGVTAGERNEQAAQDAARKG